MILHNINFSNIYVVIIGDRGNQELIYLSFHYEKALSIAKKLVSTLNRKNGQKNRFLKEKFYTQMIKEELSDYNREKSVIDFWANNINFVEIVLLEIDKEYVN